METIVDAFRPSVQEPQARGDERHANEHCEGERLVQIRSVDLVQDVVEVFNFGAMDVDLTGWRFSSHDAVQQDLFSDAVSPTALLHPEIDTATQAANNTIVLNFIFVLPFSNQIYFTNQSFLKSYSKTEANVSGIFTH